jgi:hypothetical protein
MLDDMELRRRYAVAAERPRTRHLEEAEWERLALHEMDAAERSRALAHVTGCLACSRTYRGLEVLAREAREFDPGVPAPAAPPRRPWVLGGLAAAAALAGWVVLRPLPPAAPVAEPRGADELRGGAAPTAAAPRPVAPSGRLATAPRGFRWEGMADARAYRVRVLRGDGDPVWTSPEVEGLEVAWPSDVPAAPGSYMWRVDALPRWGAAGDVVGSPFVPFEITASPR